MCSHAVCCLLWAAICTYAGYFFGVTLQNLLGDIKEYNQYIALGLLLTGFVIWFIRDVRKRKNSANAKKP